jgi:hypothetical protein
MRRVTENDKKGKGIDSHVARALRTVERQRGDSINLQICILIKLRENNSYIGEANPKPSPHMNKVAAAASARLPPAALDEEAEALRCRSKLESDPLLMHGAAVLAVAQGEHSNPHSSGRYLAVPLQSSFASTQVALRYRRRFFLDRD